MTASRQKRKKNRDPNWNGKDPKKRRKNPHANPLNLFCDKSETVVDENGKEEPYRSTCIYDTSFLFINNENVSPRKFNKTASPLLAESNLPSHCDRFEVIAVDKDKIPTELLLFSPDPKSKRKYTAKKRTSMRSVICYDTSGKTEGEIVENLPAYDGCDREKDLSKMEKSQNSFKEESVSLTKEKLKKNKQKHQQNLCKRTKTQNAVTKVSASSYFKTEKNEKKHWSHLKPVCMDINSQYVDNLVVSSADANHVIQFGENEAVQLGNNLEKGVKWNMRADLVKHEDEYTHIGKTWKGTLTGDNFKMEYGGNLQSKSQPHKVMQKYVKVQTSVMLKLSKEDEENENKENVNPASNSSYTIRSRI